MVTWKATGGKRFHNACWVFFSSMCWLLKGIECCRRGERECQRAETDWTRTIADFLLLLLLFVVETVPRGNVQCYSLDVRPSTVSAQLTRMLWLFFPSGKQKKPSPDFNSRDMQITHRIELQVLCFVVVVKRLCAQTVSLFCL